MSDWIWLDEKIYPEHSPLSRELCYAEFKNTYEFKKGEKITLRACADARYELFINGNFISRGPATPGSDFINGKTTYSYFDEYEYVSSGKDEIRLNVASVPTVLSEFSFGQSGVYIELLANGKTVGRGDKSWKCRLISERIDANFTDYTVPEHEYSTPEYVPDIYNSVKCPLKHLCCKAVKPERLDRIDLKNDTGYAVFDKIYSAYPEISVKTDGKLRVSVECSEIDGVGIFKEEFVTDRDTVHTSMRMRSVGQIKITLENISASYAYIDRADVVFESYPVSNETHLETSDALINKIFDICIHTLKICRKDLHLDSPTHQEPLACTGDYYIQALMEYMNIYDPSLTAFDIWRTAQFLEVQKGMMFHTSYSLIFPSWIYDYYMYTADPVLVKHTEKALRALLSRFDTYIGENGLLEYAPNYMFVDWVLIDENGNNTDPTNLMSHGKTEGYSMHHPPKALGQSVLCMFYYEALNTCAKLFNLLDDAKTAEECLKKAQNLKNAINSLLYDKQKGLYVGGLNTPNRVSAEQWLPENTDKVFYLKQANVLAVLFGVADKKERARILEYVVTDLKKEEMQPYFYHFLLEALLKENMFGKYGMSLIRRYESMLEKCDKGLCEAWEMFPSDCSHAWGGTPAYILKKALSGFEMLEPGYKRVRLNPRLFDLEYADFAISTPYGPITVKLTKNEKTITSPDGIQIITE